MTSEDISAGTAFYRGLLGKCPKCGKGKLFDGYLSVQGSCSFCGEPLAIYRSADGPAFFTTSIVGLLLIPVLGLSYVAWRPEPQTLLIWTTIIIAILTLVVLRLVKGAFVGLLWFRKEIDRGS
ncbi:MAG: hypothetical protein JWS10_1651 [Cypionkella sp.]|uniref:DUF983 domain-containing protein n=1 Tax=Cypionkella sp. TaxID=2811411 RepID=UPI0026192343|nr:DUF983 domain-containing protein [Cypionkella sp.]MDB5659036.1 hypothetical protein [Cypionkella sp.]